MGTINIDRSKSGLPTLTEHGGKNTSSGHSVVIAGAMGEAIRPIYQFGRKTECNGKSAVFALRQKMLVVVGKWGRQTGERVEVWRIDTIYESHAEMTLIYSEHNNNQIPFTAPPEFLREAVKAALDKCRCYHCHCLHYGS
jgi:hypothetical protein